MKRTWFVPLLVCLVALGPVAAGAGLAAPADGASAQNEVTLTVHVVDNFNSDIKDATVTVSWDGGQDSATTRSNGQALIDVPEGADLEITIEHRAYVRNNPVVVENVGSEETVEIKVFRKGEAAITVVEDGTPVEDARVTLYKRGQVADRGRTGADGVFTSGTIERGDYRVVAVKAGYLRSEDSIAVEESTEHTVSVEQGTVTVEVRVQDDHFDPPRRVEGATVAIEGVTSASIQTGGSGTAQIGLPVNAEYTLTVSKDGYVTKSRTITVRESPRSLNVTTSREPALELEALNERVVAGERVQLEVRDEYGDPVEGATILVDGEAVGQTNAEGVYRATLEEEGEHTISAETDEVASGEVTVEAVEPGGATPTAGAPATPGATPTPTETTVGVDDLTGLLGGGGLALQAGAAVIGILLALLVVRRLL